MQSSLRLSAFILLCGSALLLTGCGRAKGDLSGKVKYGAVYLKGGFVSFLSTEGQQSYTASIQEDGSYALSNVTAGTFKVTVDTSNLKGDAAAPARSKGGDKNAPDIPKTGSNPNTAKNAARYTKIPEKYSKQETTDLEYEFKGGTQVYDIELKN